jgi:hypothetical protein
VDREHFATSLGRGFSNASEGICLAIFGCEVDMLAREIDAYLADEGSIWRKG